MLEGAGILPGERKALVSSLSDYYHRAVQGFNLSIPVSLLAAPIEMCFFHDCHGLVEKVTMASRAYSFIITKHG